MLADDAARLHPFEPRRELSHVVGAGFCCCADLTCRSGHPPDLCADAVTFSCGWILRQHSTALRAPGVSSGSKAISRRSSLVSVMLLTKNALSGGGLGWFEQSLFGFFNHVIHYLFQISRLGENSQLAVG